MKNESSFDRSYFKFYDENVKHRSNRDSNLSKVINSFYDKGSLLDVGCAYGELLTKFKNFNCYGLDVSEHAVKKAEKRHPKINFKVADVQKNVPFNKKFDVITAIDVIEHLKEPLKALKNIRSKLKRGGLLFAEVPFISNVFNRLINSLAFAKDKTHIFVKPMGVFLSLAEKAGFKPVKFYAALPPFYFRLPKRVASLFCLTLVVLKSV